MAGTADSVEDAEELGRYGLLSVWGWVEVGKGVEQLFDGRPVDFAVFEVEGALGSRRFRNAAAT